MLLQALPFIPKVGQDELLPVPLVHLCVLAAPPHRMPEQQDAYHTYHRSMQLQANTRAVRRPKVSWQTVGRWGDEEAQVPHNRCVSADWPLTTQHPRIAFGF